MTTTVVRVWDNLSAVIDCDELATEKHAKREGCHMHSGAIRGDLRPFSLSGSIHVCDDLNSVFRAALTTAGHCSADVRLHISPC